MIGVHLSARFVIMQVHERYDVIVVFALPDSIRGVDKVSREVDAVVDVVAAAAPRPAVGRRQALPTVNTTHMTHSCTRHTLV